VSRNIVYQRDQLVRYFSRNRIIWSQFYESERVILDELSFDEHRAVLDLAESPRLDLRLPAGIRDAMDTA
jgi:hypothetical protein